VIGVAIVGAGDWGLNLVRAFAAQPGCTLQSVCDANPARLEAARRYGPDRTTTDLDDVLNDPAVDAVVVALPAALHHRAAAACLRAGKHALVEKPLALSLSDALDLVALARAAGRVLMVGHTFEYNAAVERAKALIDAGELGDLHYIYSQRLNLGRVRSDVNAMWSLAPHDISILRHWLGVDPASVSAYGHSHLQDGIEDVVFMHLAFPNGVHAHVHVSWLDPAKVRRATIVGSRKMVIYDDTASDRKLEIYDKGIDRRRLDQQMGRYQTFGEFQFIQRAGDIVIPVVQFPEPLEAECRHFLDCVRDGVTPRSDGLSGARVVAVLEAAQASLADRGRPVAVAPLAEAGS
jgi:predicted dehydrogenase